MANQNMTLTHTKMFSNNGIPINNCVIVSSNYIGQSNQSKRVLAPAPEPRNTVLITNNADLRCKRKIQFIPSHTVSGATMQPASVARRNARERNRVKQVNNGFAALRQHIPANILAAFAPQNGNSTSGRGANKKLSKVETLKLAVEYIRSLQQMLEDHETEMTVTKNEYYASSNSPDQFSYPIILPTPPASESSASPTPSESSTSTPVFTSPTIYKQYGYDSYEPNSPEDEELLDAIFSWQQNS